MNASFSPPPRPVYAILRVEKIKSFAELERRSAHNDRTNRSENVDPDGPAPRSLLPDMQGTLSERAKKKLEERQIALGDCTGKIIACELVMTASPEFFATCTTQEFDQWVKSSLAFAKATLGDGMIDAQLHLDEETPHIHAIGVPVAQRQKFKRGAPPRDPEAKRKWEENKRRAPLVWTLSFDAVFGGSRDTLSKLQDHYHAAVADLGLARGQRKRSDKTIDLGDGIEIDATAYGRGQNADGTDRSRRNIAPKEYRELIKRTNETAALEAQRAKAVREASEALFREAESDSEQAANDRREAQHELERALAAKSQAEESARRQQEDSARLRAEADRLLKEAQAEKKAAIDEAARIKAHFKQERENLDKERQQDQLRLGLLEKAIDDRNGLDLRPQGDAFVMEVGPMTASERAAYSDQWPRALFEIARRLAAVMAKIRRLWKFVTDRESETISAAAGVHKKELALAEKETDLVAREKALLDREASRIEVDQASQHRLLEMDQREASLAQREIALDNRSVEIDRGKRDLALTAQASMQQNAASAEWAEILNSVMSGKYYIDFEDPGKPKRLVPDDENTVVPSAMEARFATTPPEWAQSAIKAYELLARQAATVAGIEEEAVALKKRLREIVASAGPALTDEQSAHVGRINEALESSPTAAEIAARTPGGGISF